MARNENDMTDGATDSETDGTRRARNRALGENPFSAEQMADAIAKAQQRVAEDAARRKEKPLPPIVRASVRCGFENVFVNDEKGKRYETRPGKVTFKADETSDGREYTVPHGRPINLKREAFERYRRDGKVIIAQ